MFDEIFDEYRQVFSEKRFYQSFSIGIFFFALTLFFNRLASIYATTHASSAVTDFLLDNLPVFNVDLIVHEGAVLFFLFIVLLSIIKPGRLPFILKSSGLFILTRSSFMIFTHLAPFPSRSFLETGDFLSQLTTGGDYFFSGHTGLPFLMALIFWKERSIRNICLTSSVIFAISVILGHLHYSIDVFSAFFITYTIYVMSQKFFPIDWQFFLESGKRKYP